MILAAKAWRTAVPLGFLLLLSAGCISVTRSPAARFYALQPMEETGGAQLPGAGGLDNMVVGIGPVTLPEYYYRPQIVTNNSDGTVTFAQFDRWAEPLDRAMARIIARNSAILLPKISTEIFPWDSVNPARYQVSIEVVQLNCRLDGEVLMYMQWSILDTDGGENKLITKRAEYRQAVVSGNYSGLVQAMSAICESSSRDIAQALIASAKPAASQL